MAVILRCKQKVVVTPVLWCRGMDRTLEHYYHELAGVRTGRVSPVLLDGIMVDLHGDRVNLKHLATVVLKGGRTLSLTVYDRDMTGNVVAAIRDSPLQLEPREEGGQVIVPIPECVLFWLLRRCHVESGCFCRAMSLLVAAVLPRHMVTSAIRQQKMLLCNACEHCTCPISAAP